MNLAKCRVVNLQLLKSNELRLVSPVDLRGHALLGLPAAEGVDVDGSYEEKNAGNRVLRVLPTVHVIDASSTRQTRQTKLPAAIA